MAIFRILAHVCILQLFPVSLRLQISILIKDVIAHLLLLLTLLLGRLATHGERPASFSLEVFIKSNLFSLLIIFFFQRLKLKWKTIILNVGIYLCDADTFVSNDISLGGGKFDLFFA